MTIQAANLKPAIRYIRWMGNNFGDNINDLLFRDIFGVSESIGNSVPLSDGINLLGIGTLFNSHLNVTDAAALWVIGSGAGNTPYRPNLTPNNIIFFVRGPLTCQYYGLPPHLAIADAAYLLADKFTAAARSNPLPARRFGIIPHHWSMESNPQLWEQVSQRAFVIDPHLDWQTFVQQVNSCEVVVTECMHGAIAADILRKPFVVFATTPRFHAFKWLDWTASMGLPLDIRLFNFDDPEELYRTQQPVMSTAATLDRIQAQLQGKKADILRQLESIA